MFTTAVGTDMDRSKVPVISCEADEKSGTEDREDAFSLFFFFFFFFVTVIVSIGSWKLTTAAGVGTWEKEGSAGNDAVPPMPESPPPPPPLDEGAAEEDEAGCWNSRTCKSVFFWHQS